MPRPPSRLTVCMHEAGHAIIQLADDPSPWIEWIAVEGLEEGTLGCVQSHSLWQPWMAQPVANPEMRQLWATLAWRDVVIYLAGPVAELRWRRGSRLGILIHGNRMADICLGDEAPEDHTDLGRVRRRLSHAVVGDPRANFIAAWNEAERRVAEWWHEIDRLGRTLNDLGYIDDQDLLTLWEDMKPDHRDRSRRLL